MSADTSRGVIYTTANFTRLSVVSATVGVVDTRLAAATLGGRGARVYTARGWLGVVTGISAASIGGVLVYIMIGVKFLWLRFTAFCSDATFTVVQSYSLSSCKLLMAFSAGLKHGSRRTT